MNLLHQPVRMHIASVGVSKFCFLFSLAFCGLLLLLIPALQPLPRQVDLPKPRPQARPAQVGTSHQVRVPGVFLHAGKKEITAGLNRSSEGLGKPIKTEISRNSYPKTGKGVRRIPERGIGGPQEYRSHDKLELKDIFIAVKTTRKYHKSRLELLIQTWVSQAKEQTFIFTDGDDKELQMRTGKRNTFYRGKRMTTKMSLRLLQQCDPMLC